MRWAGARRAAILALMHRDWILFVSCGRVSVKRVMGLTVGQIIIWTTRVMSAGRSLRQGRLRMRIMRWRRTEAFLYDLTEGGKIMAESRNLDDCLCL